MTDIIDKDLQNKFYYRFFIIVSFILMASSLLFNSPTEILEGMKRIWLSPSNLLTDFMAVGNIGAAFFNSATMALFASIVIIVSKTELTGGLVGGFFNLLAFSFFGKTLYNFTSLLLGVYLYSRFVKEPFKNHCQLSLFASGCGPMVSFISFNAGLDPVFAILLANVLGLFVGFLLPTMSRISAGFHKGYSVYNNGLALAMMLTFIYSILTLFNIYTPQAPDTYNDPNNKLLILSLTYYIGLMLVDIVFFKGKFSLKDYIDLLRRPGHGESFFDLHPRSTIFFNMGLLGLIGTAYTFLSGANINGPIIGGILTMVGFGAHNKHAANVLPVMLGIFTAAQLGIHDPSASSIVTAGLFGTTLAPLAGGYGPVMGFIAGFTHLGLVTRSAAMHGGLVLYNNGFSGGVLATIMVNILDRFNLRKNPPSLKN